jgi:hypothetical protein
VLTSPRDEAVNSRQSQRARCAAPVLRCARVRRTCVRAFRDVIDVRTLQQCRPSNKKEEGAGKAGYRLIPMAPVRIKCTGQEPQAQPDDPAFPARWRYGLYVISPGTGSFAPVTRDARHEHHGLDLSTGRPGPHDFAVRDHRARHRATVPVHRIPRSTSVTTRTSLYRAGMRGGKHEIRKNGSKIFGLKAEFVISH